MKSSYSDIITLSRPKHVNHPPMKRSDRAAQFAAFAALNGYEDHLARMEQRVADHYNNPYR